MNMWIVIKLWLIKKKTNCYKNLHGNLHFTEGKIILNTLYCDLFSSEMITINDEKYF